MLDGLDPTKAERRHVWRCVVIEDIWIGSEDDLWQNDPIAFRVLVTLRLCVQAIGMLVDGQHEVNASFIKAVVMQSNDLDGSVPFSLDEVADYLTSDDEARRWWQSMTPDAHFPHRCPSCNSAAYIGFNQIECRARCRE